jgi:hypothetical protein
MPNISPNIINVGHSYPRGPTQTTQLSSVIKT